MRFNDLLHLVAFPWKAHGTPPAPGFVTATKMPESRALSKFSDHFSRYIPLSGSLPRPGLDVQSPLRERCRCGFDVALRKQHGPVVGVFKSFFLGPVRRLECLSPSPAGLRPAVGVLSPSPAGHRSVAGADPSGHWATGAERLIALCPHPG